MSYFIQNFEQVTPNKHSYRLVFFFVVEIYCRRDRSTEMKKTNAGNPLWHLTFTHNVLVRHKCTLWTEKKNLMNETREWNARLLRVMDEMHKDCRSFVFFQYILFLQNIFMSSSFFSLIGNNICTLSLKQII